MSGDCDAVSTPVNAVELREITKSYRMGNVDVPVLRGVNMSVARRESVALIGESGSGKSTLLNLIGLLDRPDGGEMLVDGIPVERADDVALSRYRNQSVGFVFQSFHLLTNLSALENVMLPFRYRNVPRPQAAAAARQALEEVGMSHRIDHRPAQMSGGERQRVAIARAIVGEPGIILADEPTGNLDSRNTAEILDLFERIHENGRTLVIVTHEEQVARRCGRMIRVKDGRVVDSAIW